MPHRLHQRIFAVFLSIIGSCSGSLSSFELYPNHIMEIRARIREIVGSGSCSRSSNDPTPDPYPLRILIRAIYVLPSFFYKDKALWSGPRYPRLFGRFICFHYSVPNERTMVVVSEVFSRNPGNKHEHMVT